MVAKYQKVFSYWLQSPKKCANHYSKHLFYVHIGQDNDFAHFLAIGATIKNFLGLSHL